MSDLRTVVDQMGQGATFLFPLKRIISLVPSQTEFLLDIGAPVVGRTKFCAHPKRKVKNIPVIGGTKDFRFEAIRELNPDLIIGNKEENYKAGISKLTEKFPVWMSDIYSLDDAFNMMEALGHVCNGEKKADDIINDCRAALDTVKKTRSGRVVYLIWKKPWMAAGKSTFIDHMLHFLGYENAVTKERYPELTDDDIMLLNPNVILLSSEPYPFKRTHQEDARKRWPTSECQLVNGELMSWPGSRLRYWLGAR